MVVAFCAHTGAALDCALRALGLSEQALACQIILRWALGACLYAFSLQKKHQNASISLVNQPNMLFQM